jgi:hypothetical protein
MQLWRVGACPPEVIAEGPPNANPQFHEPVGAMMKPIGAMLARRFDDISDGCEVPVVLSQVPPEAVRFAVRP